MSAKCNYNIRLTHWKQVENIRKTIGSNILQSRHSATTIYQSSSGAQVFASGSMQWNWGLDDFAGEIAPPPPYGPYVHPAAQQMTHNVLRAFSGRPTAAVIFANADPVTSGNWTSLYGSQGYWIADTTTLTNLPSYAQVTITNQQVQVWTNQATDPRALLKPTSYTNRVAAAWTTGTNQNSSFTIDLNFTGTNTHQVSLYCADWLGSGTVLEKFEVFDYPDTSNPLDIRYFTLPPNGVYLVWKLSGHKTIRITKPNGTTGNKAMVSALFFDPSP